MKYQDMITKFFHNKDSEEAKWFIVNLFTYDKDGEESNIIEHEDLWEQNPDVKVLCGDAELGLEQTIANLFREFNRLVDKAAKKRTKKILKHIRTHLGLLDVDSY